MSEMFIELNQPRTIDLVSTRDRCKVRIGEYQDLRLALVLSFENKTEALAFVDGMRSKLMESPKNDSY